jgi:hypothetical protein
VKVGSWFDQTFDHSCLGTGSQNWKFYDFEFVARGANEVLSFESVSSGVGSGPLLDGVKLIDVTQGCVGDIDGDGSVSGSDISLLLLNFGDCAQ